MYNTYYSNPTLVNCTFTENYGYPTAGNLDYGGGIYNYYYSNLRLTNCILNDNSAYFGGAICNYESSSILVNCTLSGNSASLGKGIYNYHSDSQIMNSILWDGSDEIRNNNSVTVINYSAVQNGWPGEGNISVDPCFANINNQDYHLKSQAGRWDPQSKSWVNDITTSYCIDAGNPGSPLNNEPSAHNNVRIDMGAYGGTSEASKTPNNWSLLADLTNNGIVNILDFSSLAQYWAGMENGQVGGDLNRDGTVDFKDFALFVEYWLKETSWHKL